MEQMNLFDLFGDDLNEENAVEEAAAAVAEPKADAEPGGYTDEERAAMLKKLDKVGYVFLCNEGNPGELVFEKNGERCVMKGWHEAQMMIDLMCPKDDGDVADNDTPPFDCEDAPDDTAPESGNEPQDLPEGFISDEEGDDGAEPEDAAEAESVTVEISDGVKKDVPGKAEDPAAGGKKKEQEKPYSVTWDELEQLKAGDVSGLNQAVVKMFTSWLPEKKRAFLPEIAGYLDAIFKRDNIDAFAEANDKIMLHGQDVVMVAYAIRESLGDPELAAFALQPGKSMKGLEKYTNQEAQKMHREAGNGGNWCLSPHEVVFGWIKDYLKVDEKAKAEEEAKRKAEAEEKKKAAEAKKKKKAASGKKTPEAKAAKDSGPKTVGLEDLFDFGF